VNASVETCLPILLEIFLTGARERAGETGSALAATDAMLMQAAGPTLDSCRIIGAAREWMQQVTIRCFVSSTWFDLQPEREAVETLLQRFRETKFIGMEYFGSRDETTRQASLNEVDRSDLYVGIVGGRYGSGITEKRIRPGNRE
jgi:hypothetical protein